MAQNNAICSICGKPYHMCLVCKDYARLHPWQLHTDTAEHYRIYQILHGINHGFYSKEEGIEQLQNVDLSDRETFVDDVKKQLEELLDKENS